MEGNSICSQLSYIVHTKYVLPVIMSICPFFPAVMPAPPRALRELPALDPEDLRGFLSTAARFSRLFFFTHVPFFCLSFLPSLISPATSTLSNQMTNIYTHFCSSLSIMKERKKKGFWRLAVQLALWIYIGIRVAQTHTPI